jgi:hypothetical protein
VITPLFPSYFTSVLSAACIHLPSYSLLVSQFLTSLREDRSKMADPIMKEAMHDTEGLGSKTGYREGAIAGEGGETKRGLKSRHIQFL